MKGAIKTRVPLFIHMDSPNYFKDIKNIFKNKIFDNTIVFIHKGSKF